jgi:hypothetical protein
MNNNHQYLSYSADCGTNHTGESLQKVNLTNKVCTNSGFNYGASDKLQYDNDYINDNIEQSTAPLLSVLDPNRVKSCSNCISLFGPRPSHNGVEDSIPIANPGLTPAQELVDIDSIMSNRNVKNDRSKKGKVNTVDVFKFKTYDAKFCDRGLDPLSSILTYPKQLYREISINRFYDMNLNPQTNIYYDWGTNTRLEAKDNYDYPYPFSLATDESLPKTNTGNVPPCTTNCKDNKFTKVLNRNRNESGDSDNESKLSDVVDADSDYEM